jgi:hypothetical protein
LKFVIGNPTHITFIAESFNVRYWFGIYFLIETIDEITHRITNNNWLGNRIMHPVFVNNIWFTQRFLTFGALTEGEKVNEE